MTKRSNNQDAFNRINYLYQASHLLLMNNNNHNLSAYYNHLITQIAKRNVMRLNQSIKRTICDECKGLLLPGLSSTVRVHQDRESHISNTCTHCNNTNRYHTNKKRERNRLAKSKKIQQEQQQQQQEGKETIAKD